MLVLLGSFPASLLSRRSEKTGSFPQGRYFPDEKRYERMTGPRQTPRSFYG